MGMLVLSRELDEIVNTINHQTGEILRIKVVGLRHGKVRLGFEAPDHYEILREELDQPRGPMGRASQETASVPAGDPICIRHEDRLRRLKQANAVCAAQAEDVVPSGSQCGADDGPMCERR